MIEAEEQAATRQCWDCLKRRLVCDHTLPHCKKCQKAGRQCSGYDEAKPLQWVQTGMVTSRRRKTKRISTPKNYTVAPARRKDKQEYFNQAGKFNEKVCRPMDEDDYVCEPIGYEASLAAWMTSQYAHARSLVTDLHVLSFKMAASAKEAARIFQIWGRAKVEEVVEKNSYEEAAEILRSNRDPLGRLKRLLWALQRQDVPRYDFLESETYEVVQAVQYYNVRIHPSYKTAEELAPNPAIITFSPHVLHLITPAIHHTLVCLSLNHYVYSLPAGIDRRIVAGNRSKVYHHRGSALRALNQCIGQDKTRCSDMTITAVFMFMCLELQTPAFNDWRSHFNGMRRLMDLRGGPKKLMEDAPHLTPSLVLYLLTASLANTSSPSWDQVEISCATEYTTADMESIYSLMYPYTLCPFELFTEILQTNRLRAKASEAAMSLCDVDSGLMLAGHDLLRRIGSFSPKEWAQSGDSHAEWLMVGTVYTSAVSLYATLSLGSLGVLPPTVALHNSQTAHEDTLFCELRAALKVPRIAKFMVWSLVVAGVCAKERGEATRNWIEVSLGDISRVLGTSCPIKACAVLKRYWASDVSGWDQCFDRPYVLVV